MPSVGIKSAIEFSCVVESAIEISSQINNPLKIDAETEEIETITRSKFYSFFQVVSAWALGEQRLNTLAEALPEPLPEWPSEIKSTWLEFGSMSTKDLAGDELNYYSVPKLITQEFICMNNKMLEIAKERTLAVSPIATLQELGDKLSITRERVRQIENKTLLELETRFKNTRNLPVIRRAEFLRNQLGSAVQWNNPNVKDSLNLVVEDFDKEYSNRQLVKLLLMWLAGPYKVRDNWLLIDSELLSKSIDSIFQCQDERGFISHDTVQEILNGLGINEENHNPWLKHLKIFLQVEDGYIVFRGTLLDKAYSLLKYFNRPMTVEEMLEYLGSRSVTGLRDRLNSDPRFWRINVQNQYVLSGMIGYEEYTNIVDKLIQEIQLGGGRASNSYLVETLAQKYGVKRNSVTSYLTTPIFIKDNYGYVRIRDSQEIINCTPDLNNVAGCYLSNDGLWCYRLTIDKNVKRGSGCNIPNSFAQQLGGKLNENIEVPTEFGEITVNWPLTSLSGAYLSTLRKISDEIGADFGDYLFIKATKPLVTFSCLKQKRLDYESSNLVKLALLVGGINCRTEDDALVEIASSLEVSQTSKEATLAEARRKLKSRGEFRLFQFIQHH